MSVAKIYFFKQSAQYPKDAKVNEQELNRNSQILQCIRRTYQTLLGSIIRTSGSIGLR